MAKSVQICQQKCEKIKFGITILRILLLGGIVSLDVHFSFVFAQSSKITPRNLTYSNIVLDTNNPIKKLVKSFDLSSPNVRYDKAGVMYKTCNKQTRSKDIAINRDMCDIYVTSFSKVSFCINCEQQISNMRPNILTTILYEV